MFIIADLCTGLFLYVSARRFLIYLKKEHKDTNKFAKDIEYCLLTDDEYRKIPLYVLMAVLFNPFTLIGCIGYSTIQIHNFFLSIFLCSLVYGELILGPAALAICTSVSFYPFILIVPYCISFITVHKHKIKASLVLLFYVVFLALITMCNSNWGTDYSFVKNVYGCILTVPDLQPNIGLFWYFFTEMFDHFRDLFIYSFQINATILYLVPLSLKFRNQPFLLVVSLLFLISIFKSYPCVSDLGFVLSVLPNFLHLFPFCQQGFLVGVIFLITTTLAPILWYLWIYCNSANANFYFGVTLAFAIAQIFLITDILFAQIKREFTLNNGKERKIDGDEAILSLE
ncbi:phosphatidylinositol glycan anchor biosynthesis class U protein [Cylas formicarius]|uniref:phosphatidylinositol glycan anchor biosynthesis class U protein n=1 Tax=Cylas formicarius TaxID=197179 RepID=UPI00295855FA|nr:phosphatidylinositol glycan anchor biosynthesis class U protein [Cylas formicarius]